jgi:RNA recognition motif-containing protein
LDITVDNEALMNHFKARCPTAHSARIIVDLGSQLSKGYGFVTFPNRPDAEEAMSKMNGTYLRGKPIKVKESFSRSSQGGSSGATAPKKEKMTPLQIQRMHQSGGGGMGYGGGPSYGGAPGYPN